MAISYQLEPELWPTGAQMTQTICYSNQKPNSIREQSQILKT